MLERTSHLATCVVSIPLVFNPAAPLSLNIFDVGYTHTTIISTSFRALVLTHSRFVLLRAMLKIRDHLPKSKLNPSSPLFQHQVVQQPRDDLDVNAVSNKTIPRLARRRCGPFKLLVYLHSPLVLLPMWATWRSRRWLY